MDDRPSRAGRGDELEMTRLVEDAEFHVVTRSLACFCVATHQVQGNDVVQRPANEALRYSQGQKL